jgi:hypothetical protein
LVTVALLSAGCGESSENDSHQAGGGAGMSAPTGGFTGVGGSTATGGSAASAGAADVTGPVPDAQSTALPPPGIDCRVDTTIKNCVSVAGTFGGITIDTACATENGIAALAFGDTWLFGCEEPEAGYEVRAEVPMRRPGIFTDSTVEADSNRKFNVMVADASAMPARGASISDDHFVRAEIAGAVTRLPNENLLVLGTFHVVWTSPDPFCNPDYGDECVGAELNGTFRAEQAFGTCFDGSDCKSGRCENIGKTCFKQY